MGDSLLLIFVKNPIAGKVKTRLARSVGTEKALEVYHKLLDITREITTSLSCHRQVWYSNYVDDEDRWEKGDYEKRLQSGGDLGDRMQNAFKQAFADEYEKVVIIGSDCAELTQEIIEEAFNTLDNCDVVIGPSKDGGYYLLGMNSFYGDLFSGINWSTPAVYEQTIGRVKELDLSFRSLRTLNDIDTKQDIIESGEKLGL